MMIDLFDIVLPPGVQRIRDTKEIEKWLRKITPPGKLGQVKADIQRRGYWWGRYATPMPDTRMLGVSVVIGELRNYKIHWQWFALMGPEESTKTLYAMSKFIVEAFKEWLDELEKIVIEMKRSGEL